MERITDAGAGAALAAVMMGPINDRTKDAQLAAAAAAKSIAAKDQCFLLDMATKMNMLRYKQLSDDEAAGRPLELFWGLCRLAVCGRDKSQEEKT